MHGADSGLLLDFSQRRTWHSPMGVDRQIVDALVLMNGEQDEFLRLEWKI